MASGSRTSVFVTYSHKDSKWLERLRVHLTPLERDGAFSLWADTRIKYGQNWKMEIAAALKSAKVAVLLVSADFLASDFIATQELPPLLAAAEVDGAVILPIIIKPSLFQQTKGLKDFHAVNAPSEPIIGMEEVAQEQTFVNLAIRIVEVFEASSKTEQGSDIVSPDEEIAKGDDQVFHPGIWSSSRSALEACRFFVSPFYKKTKNWDLYGDVQVEILHHPSGERVFLIPSGAVPPQLRETDYLRTLEGESIVRRKRDAAASFVQQWRNQELLGYKFDLKTNPVRTKVYCAAYDRCLVEAISDTQGGTGG